MLMSPLVLDPYKTKATGRSSSFKRRCTDCRHYRLAPRGYALCTRTTSAELTEYQRMKRGLVRWLFFLATRWARPCGPGGRFFDRRPLNKPPIKKRLAD